MDPLHSLVNAMKRKRADERTTTTATTTTTPGAGQPAVTTTVAPKKFQRRGEGRDRPTSLFDTPATTTTTPAPTTTTKQTTDDAMTDAITTTNQSQQQNQEPTPTTTTTPQEKQQQQQSTAEDLTNIATTPLTTEEKIELEEYEKQYREALQKRYQELLLARNAHYSINKPLSDFPHPAEYLSFALKRNLWVWETDLDARGAELKKEQKLVEDTLRKLRASGQEFLLHQTIQRKFSEEDELIFQRDFEEYDLMLETLQPLFRDLHALSTRKELPPKETKTTNNYATTQALKQTVVGQNAYKITYEILFGLCDVFDHLRKGDYLQAQQEYYEMTIGDALWPIGLPRVGIHERKSRAKIETYNVEHILKDPIIKAYMHAVKSILTYIEKKFPNGEKV